jgi:hypothetical protein
VILYTPPKTRALQYYSAELLILDLKRVMRDESAPGSPVSPSERSMPYSSKIDTHLRSGTIGLFHLKDMNSILQHVSLF